MLEIPRKQLWAQQPQFYREVNWGNPLTKGLAALFNTAAALELVYKNPASNVTNTVTPGAGLLGADFSGTANQQYAHRPGYGTTGPMTLFLLCELHTLSNYTGIIAKQSTTTTNAPYELRLGFAATDGKVQLLRASASSYNGSTNNTSIFSAAPGSVQKIFLTVTDGDIGTKFNYNINGTTGTFTSNITGSTGACTDAATSVWIGRRYDGATQLDGRLFYIALWSRVLSADEQRSLSENPWQLFAP